MLSEPEKNAGKNGLPRPKSALARFWALALDMLLPPRCLGSGEIVDAQGMVSPAFWTQLGFIEAPCCAICGLPFAFAAPEGMLCAACLEEEPAFDRARAAVVYNEASRQMILDFKYGDRLHAVDTFLPWMMRSGAEMLAAADLILPVPLHARRLWQRRFNQSALLAQKLARRSGKEYLPDALLRARHTVPQKGLNRKERRLNVRNAFAVAPRHAETIRGRKALLVDDVFTSGATLNECARVLRKAGAEKVFVLTVARVTQEEF